MNLSDVQRLEKNMDGGECWDSGHHQMAALPGRMVDTGRGGVHGSKASANCGGDDGEKPPSLGEAS